MSVELDNWTNIHILKVESCYHSRLTRETIHIRRQSISLNRNRGCLSDIYNLATQ